MIQSNIILEFFYMICLFFPTTIIHEIGHKIATSYFGFESKIVIGWKGAHCEYLIDEEHISRSQTRIIAFSGGAFTSLIMFVCYLIYPTFWILAWVISEIVYAFYETYVFIE